MSQSHQNSASSCIHIGLGFMGQHSSFRVALNANILKNNLET